MPGPPNSKQNSIIKKHKMSIKTSAEFYQSEIDKKPSTQAKKSFLTKSQNKAQKELDFINETPSSIFYLGEPKHPITRDLEDEIIAISKVKKINNF